LQPPLAPEVVVGAVTRISSLRLIPMRCQRPVKPASKLGRDPLSHRQEPPVAASLKATRRVGRTHSALHYNHDLDIAVPAQHVDTDVVLVTDEQQVDGRSADLQ